MAGPPSGPPASGYGITRAHTWGLVVPLLAALSPYWLGKYATIQGLHPALNAIVNGIIVAIVAYVLMTRVPYLKESAHALSKAVLCGILVAEITIVRQYSTIPPMGTITLWLYLYYHTMEHHH